MTRSTCLVLAVAAACSDLLAQSNERGAGYDGALANISSATYYGRRGAAYPGGEIGVAFQNQLCNPGTIPVEWRSPGGSIGATIQSDHPKFGFLVAREVSGRIVQISDWSYCKHAFLSLNSGSVSPCLGGCVTPPAGGAQLGVKCSDIYSASNNASRTYLGPPAEINPWLCSWPSTGNYFDVGDPATGLGPADGLRSLSTSGFDVVKNRVTIKEADIQGGVSTGLYFQIHVLHEGERVENRGNNIMSRPFTLAWSGTAWSTSTTGTASYGTIMNRWPGATITYGSNGGTGTLTDADGRFAVAVKVSGPVGGVWHYEYCVHNIDNHRGGATFSLPVCPGGQVTNIGFRDIDQNPLNDWTSSLSGGALTFSAPANNPHNWNTLYNFYFDSDVGPTAGNATIDQARPGPGALTVSVPTTVPGHQHAIQLGAGCGAPATTMTINGVPSAGNAGFGLNITTESLAPVILFFSFSAGQTTLAPGCDTYLNLLAFADAGLYFADGAGLATVPMPVSPTQTPAELTFQAASFLTSPPLFGLLGLSNGLTVRFASLGCQ
ncbi:MAG: hypothetical protein WAT39_22095 [Planctomycetota bacterium]